MANTSFQSLHGYTPTSGIISESNDDRPEIVKIWQALRAIESGWDFCEVVHEGKAYRHNEPGFDDALEAARVRLQNCLREALRNLIIIDNRGDVATFDINGTDGNELLIFATDPVEYRRSRASWVGISENPTNIEAAQWLRRDGCCPDNVTVTIGEEHDDF